MTFGQHLEELRKCLWKSILGLIAGVMVGMFVGGYVVDLIQLPLTKALSNYYQKQTEAKLLASKDKGDAAENKANKEEIENTVLKRQMLVDEVYVDPAELASQLKIAYPEEFKNIQPPQKSNKEETDGLNPYFFSGTK